jgi:hypothetical protein
MSAETGATTFALPHDQIPRSFSSLDERKKFITAQTNRAYELFVSLAGTWDPCKLPNTPGFEQEVLKSALVLSGTSRNAWFEHYLGLLLKMHGSASLEVLTLQAKTFPFEEIQVGEGEYAFIQHLRYVVLETPLISSTASNIRSFLQWSEANIESVASVLETECSREDLEISLRAQTISFRPDFYHPTLRFDEGVGPEYLYLYLRSLLTLLEEAQARSCFVVHFQEQPIC